MRQTAEKYLVAIREQMRNDLSLDELRGLFLPGAHSTILSSRRMGAITSRVRAVAALFSVLTLLWIGIDLVVFPWPIWPQLAVLRLAASIAFGMLAFNSGESSQTRYVYREMAMLFAIPVLFFVASHSLLSPLQATDGLAGIAATGYTLLPFVLVAGVSMFPLTALEGLACAFPILAVETGMAALNLDGLGWSTHLGTVWLLLLSAVVATLAGMSQLGLMTALVRQATRDSLTGCFTRCSGEELLEVQLNIAERNQYPLSVVFADLDNFKPINDAHGHKAGDKVLAKAAKIMNCSLRTSDILVRWGGEEFVLILPNTDLNNAIGVIERLRKHGLGIRPDGQPMTASFGIAEYLQDDAESSHDLLEIADRRMYMAKHSGKNRLVSNGPDTRVPAFVATQASPG